MGAVRTEIRSGILNNLTQLNLKRQKKDCEESGFVFHHGDMQDDIENALKEIMDAFDAKGEKQKAG